MSLDWQSFKSSLGNLENVTVAYIDDEGFEIPVNTQIEFQEALKFAKSSSKDKFRIIVKCKDSKPLNSIPTPAQTQPQENTNNMGNNNLNSDVGVKVTPTSDNEHQQVNNVNQTNEQKWNHNSEISPFWFSQQIKKFKKKLLEEVKGTINEAVHNAFKKEMKTLKAKMENSEKVYNMSCSSVNKSKNSSKDFVDLAWEQRERELTRKFKKFHLAKLQKLQSRLDKLDVETKYLVEGRQKQRSHKSESNKNNWEPYLKSYNIPKMLSATFETEDIKTQYQTGQDICIKLTIKNTGWVSWKNSKVVCWAMEGLTLDKTCFNLNQLLPGDQCVLKLKGKVAHQIGVYRLKCRIYEGSQELCSPLVCTIRVVEKSNDEPADKNLSPEIIVNCQKKIEDNISEIEKRLQSMSFQSSILESSASKPVEKTSNEKKEGEKLFRLNDESGAIGIKDSGELHEGKMNTKPNNETLLGFGVGPDLLQHTEAKEFVVEDEPDSFVEFKDGSEMDSDPHAFYASDEEDNFILITMPDSREITEAKQEKETKSSVAVEQLPSTTSITTRTTSSSTTTASTTPGRISSTATIKVEPLWENELPREKKIFRGRAMKKLKKTTGNQRNRSPLALDVEETKAKKLKSSSEYHFTAANATHPNFSIRSENMKTEKSENDRRKKFKNALRNHKLGSGKIRTVDSAGKLILAVNSRGQCTPLIDVLRNEKEEFEEKANRSQNEKIKCNRKQSDRGNGPPSNRPSASNEGGAEASVNILPGVLMNGATNMASLALNTAKSVISNLQSAFIADGKAEEGRPAFEAKKENEPSMEAMFNLFEMGFQDVETNKRLLSAHANDLSKVIEELVARESENVENFVP